MDLLEILADLHESSIQLLLARIKDKSATASDIAQAVALLKHNNISAHKDDDKELQELQNRLQQRRGGRSRLRVVNGADLDDLET